MVRILLVACALVVAVLLLGLLVVWMDWMEARCSPHARLYPLPPRHWSGQYSKPLGHPVEGLHHIQSTKGEDHDH